MGWGDGTPPDDDREFLAKLRAGGCTGRGRMYDIERQAHDPHDLRDPLERSPMAEALLGVAFLVMAGLAVFGLWVAARDLFRLIH